MPAKILFQYQSTSGSTFCVSPKLVGDIEALIDQVRAEVAAKRAAGLFIGYLSVPVSAKSGGDFKTNTNMASNITERVQGKFGSQLWILNPAAYNLPRDATGGDYMAVWSDVLAGPDGSGSDFDIVYFVGPTDVWQFFDIGELDMLGTIEKWLMKQADIDPTYKAIYDDKTLRQKFIKYYGLRGSTIYSKGAHDEWNIVLTLNSKRPIGEDIAVYFDGRPIEPGDYQDSVDAGYETMLR
ncbi:hypothetical protein Pres01_27510 [Metapseudomonas resinovorans]|uniref:hypothetical protein n=1 Tax=Metapseudomonas resinovorans TaxID=53412 RepID=UPI0009879D04|nr:hypothetical protein [Pseudomonas resinovorans]GLZ86700.1 hypothetical protein Pres01_27510 [Pseudomonas resinovorans]